MLLKEKEKIEYWLNKYDITNDEIIKDKEYGYVVNVNNYLDLSYKKLKSRDIKFNKINGSFYCNDNELESLKGCPEVVEGSLKCNWNNLKSLEYSPKIVKGDFIGDFNKLNIDGLFFIKEIKLNCYYINNNKNLGDLENIIDFKILKEKLILLEIKKRTKKIIK